jgi:hypothetical protein
MSEREAREHLLFILEEMLGSDSEIADLMHRFGIEPSTAKVYAALRRASPRSLSKDQLGAARVSDLLCMSDPVHASSKGSMHDDLQGTSG